MNKSEPWRHPFASVEDVARILDSENYVADRPLCLTTKLAFDLQKPVLLEGEDQSEDQPPPAPHSQLLPARRTRIN